MGGGPPLRVFSVDERARVDYTTPVRNLRVTGLAFPGGRPFRFQKGRGFGVFSLPRPTNSFSGWPSLFFLGLPRSRHILHLCSYICGVILFVHGPVRVGRNQGQGERTKVWVRFEDAMLVFADPYALVEQDRLEGGEIRWQTLGLAGGIVLLLVAHTARNEQEDEIIRIISARKAVRKERKRYDENRKEESLG